MNFRKPWQRIALALGGLTLFELGGRVGLPGLDGQALGTFFRGRAEGGLLALYNVLVGGGLSRGVVLALGIVPYLSASVMMRLFRVVSPEVEALTGTVGGRARLRWSTRVLTVGLALIQSYGFARFVQSVPGAVTDPGLGFIAQTMLVLTAGSVVAMAITEAISGSGDHERPVRPTADPRLSGGMIDEVVIAKPREKQEVW